MILHLVGLNVGDIVTLSSSASTVKNSFNNLWTILSGIYTRLIWDNKMYDMLGKKYTVLGIYENNVIALPSPDGSQDGKIYFSILVVSKDGKTIQWDIHRIIPTCVNTFLLHCAIIFI